MFARSKNSWFVYSESCDSWRRSLSNCANGICFIASDSTGDRFFSASTRGSAESSWCGRDIRRKRRGWTKQFFSAGERSIFCPFNRIPKRIPRRRTGRYVHEALLLSKMMIKSSYWKRMTRDSTDCCLPSDCFSFTYANTPTYTLLTLGSGVWPCHNLSLTFSFNLSSCA